MTAISASPPGRVHVLGAGPVGLLLTALLQTSAGCRVTLYEKRKAYTRTRMVRLAPYLVADTLEDYRTDTADGENIEAVFDAAELEEGLEFRRSLPADLMALLREWTLGFCPLNTIEQALSDLIDARQTGTVERVRATLTAEEAMALLAPGDILVDCTGSRSLLRDHLVPGGGAAAAGLAVEGANTASFRLEYAIVTTFLFGGAYVCNELCKYYKNEGNRAYKFIPAVDRTCYDGDVSHVTGIVVISAEEYEAMPARFDGQWLRGQFPDVAGSMDRFIDKIRQETSGDLVGDLEIIRIPLMLYHARNATNRKWRNGAAGGHPFADASVFLLGDAAIGSPYFQSISLGFECAMFLAGLLAQRDLPTAEVLDRYELLTYKQWLRVYMRSKMIKHNKDLFETIDDKLAVLGKLRIY
jgi:2-polyprenyl-6-methoxyphenol hydroxylase-like FAD-dependent oxidoreductase